MPPKRSHVNKLVELGLTKAQIDSIPAVHHAKLVKHLERGGSFSSFFNKIKDGIVGAATKVKDWMETKHELPEPLYKALTFTRDTVNPALVGVLKGMAASGVPGLSQVGTVGSLLGDQYLKVMPPGGAIKSRRGGAKVDLSVFENQEKLRKRGAALRDAAVKKYTRICSLCGSAGATAATCPLSSTAKHHRYSKHPAAMALKRSRRG